jgi:hypothetical protein
MLKKTEPEKIQPQKPQKGTAVLVLEDGKRFIGRTYGAEGRTLGEIVFATGMTGYQETLTDPSYAGQIVLMTAPHIGNTGTNDNDNECENHPESCQIFGRNAVLMTILSTVELWGLVALIRVLLLVIFALWAQCEPESFRAISQTLPQRNNSCRLFPVLK